MVGFRKYGSAPYSVVLLHGGPGAPGMMKSLAEIISADFGVIEPLQSEKTIMGQVEELKTILNREGDPPFVLIGHSWGAWLGYIFAAKELLELKKLIMVGSGPFQEKYIEKMVKTRAGRLTEKETQDVKELKGLLQKNPGDKEVFARFGEIMNKVDSYDPVTLESSILEFQPEVFASITGEINKLRRSGMLLNLGRKINCPVVAIHGEYDPHPYQGVKEPLTGVVADFSFFLLENCGHTPWKEKKAGEQFLQILVKEIKK